MSVTLNPLASPIELGFQGKASIDLSKKEQNHQDDEDIASRVEIIRTNIFDWTELVPFSLERATGNFFVELVTKKEPDAIDMSSWIRLINDKGEIISVGLDQAIFHNERNVRLASPVYNEFVNTNELATRFNITQKQFKALKARIELDQKSGIKKSNDPIYAIFSKKNSLTYTTELLEDIGIEVKNKELFVISWGRKALCFFRIDMPEYVEKIVLAVVHFFKEIVNILFNINLLNFLSPIFSMQKILKLPIFKIKLEDYEYPSIHKTLKFQESIENQRHSIHAKFKAQTRRHKSRTVELFNKEMKLKLTKSKELAAFIKTATEKDLKFIEYARNNKCL